MAELNIFHYRPGSGPIHRTDSRVKLLILILVVISTLSTGIIGLAVLTLLLTVIAVLTPLHLERFLRELIFFGILACIIWISRPTVTAGALSAWRFLLVVFAGMIFTASTGPEEIHAVLFTLLSPLPLIPHGRIAEHVSLTILFIPILFDAAKEIGEARKARLIVESRNLVRRLTSLATPLMEALIIRIEEVALALEARGFDEDVVRFELHGRLSDIVTALAGLGISTLIILWG